MGFRGAMRTRYPDRAMIEIDNSDGLDETMPGLVLSALDRNPNMVPCTPLAAATWPLSKLCLQAAPVLGLHRPRPGPGQHAAAPGRPDFSRAPSRPQARHASGLLHDHAGAQSATRCRLLLAIEHPHHYAVQHAGTGALPSLRAVLIPAGAARCRVNSSVAGRCANKQPQSNQIIR